MPCRSIPYLLSLLFLLLSVGKLMGQGLSPKKRAIISEQVEAAAAAFKSGALGACDSLLVSSEQLGKKRLYRDSLGFEVLTIRALLSAELKDYEQAIQHLKRGAQIRERLYGTESLEAIQGQEILANTYLGIGDYEKTLAVGKQMLATLSVLQQENNLLAARVYRLISSGNIGLQRLDEAADDLKKALAIQTKLLPPNSGTTSSTYRRLGELAVQLGNFSEAADHFINAIAINELIGIPRRALQPTLHYNLGIAQYNAGQLSASLATMKKGLRMAEDIYGPGHSSTTVTLNGLGQILIQAGRYREGIDYLERCDSILATTPSSNPFERITLVAGIGTGYLSLRELEQAETYYLKALKLLRKTPQGAPPLEYQILYSLAGTYSDAGKSRLALQRLQEAQRLAEKTSAINEKIRGELYEILAQTYADIGAYDQAVRSLEIGLDLLRTKLTEPHPAIGRIYARMGSLQREGGALRPAIPLFKRALDNLRPTLAKTDYYFATLLLLGSSYIDLEELPPAERIAVELNQMVQDTTIEELNVGAYFQYRGELAQLKGDLHTATQFYAKAASAQAEKFPETYKLIGEILEKQGLSMVRPETCVEASEVLTAALHNLQQDPFLTPSELVSTYFGLAQAYRLAEETNRSDRYLDSMIWAATQLPNFTVSPQARRVALAYNQGLLTQLLDRYYTAGGNDRISLSAIFSIIDYYRYDAVRENIRNVRAYQQNTAPNSLWTTLIDLQQRIKRKEEDIRSSLAVPPDSTNTTLQLRLQREDLLRQLENTQQQLTKKQPRYARLKREYAALDPAALQAQIGVDRSLISYAVTEEKVFIFLLNDGQLSLVSRRHDGQLQPLIDTLLGGITNFYTAPLDQRSDELEYASSEQYTRAAHQLYRLLILPIKHQLKEQVVVVPDGDIGFIPFNALLSRSVAEEDIGRFGQYPYLAYQHGFTRIYSGTLLLQDEAVTGLTRQAKPLLGMAPFSGEEVDAVRDQQFRSVVSTEERPILSPLPGSGKELKNIANIWSSDVYFDERATKQQLLRSIRQYQVLHLATHAKADVIDGADGYLALRDTADVYSRLHARELYEYTLPTELVFLSACETGVGTLARGEGIISLGRAFRFAGARSIFSTLWLLTDLSSTSAIVTDFYQYLHDGQAKDLALRNALRNYLSKSNPERMHPFFWAGIIGTGSMQAIR
ncbi:MAG: CHAT domain-containing protein [Bacteroidota bacterium]